MTTNNVPRIGSKWKLKNSQIWVQVEIFHSTPTNVAYVNCWDSRNGVESMSLPKFLEHFKPYDPK